MASAKARRRRDVPHDYWRRPVAPVTLGEERFRFTLLRPGQRAVNVNDYVSQVDWSDEQAELTGSVQMAVDADVLRIVPSTKLRAEWAPSAQAPFRRIFTMQCGTPQYTLSSDNWSTELSSTLTRLRKNREDFRFKRDKAHPRGWTADQVARHVARRCQLPVGRLAKCSHRITNLARKNADPMDMIILAYRAERRATGRKFFLVWDGSLNVLPLKRSRYLLELSSALIDGTYQEQMRESFATVLTVRAKAKKGRKHRKIRVQVRSEAGVRRYGYVHRTVHAPDADTEDEARKYGRRVLARALKPQRTLEVTVPLMPGVRRGDAFRVLWKGVGLKQIVFVAAATHSVSAGAATTTITARFDDPYVDTRGDKAARKRAAKARERRRKVHPDDSRSQSAAVRTRTSAKAKRRGDA